MTDGSGSAQRTLSASFSPFPVINILIHPSVNGSDRSG